jgi:hypothetical protein
VLSLPSPLYQCCHAIIAGHWFVTAAVMVLSFQDYTMHGEQASHNDGKDSNSANTPYNIHFKGEMVVQ